MVSLHVREREVKRKDVLAVELLEYFPDVYLLVFLIVWLGCFPLKSFIYFCMPPQYEDSVVAVIGKTET